MAGCVKSVASALAGALVLFSVGWQSSAANTVRLGLPGTDSREIVEGNKYPWRAIGRVNNAGRSFCTGVLIGERKVLTAAHCLRGRGNRGGVAKPGDVHFLAGYTRGSYLAHSRALSIDRSPARGVEEKLQDDWAVITLTEPIGKKVGFLPLETFGSGTWRRDKNAGTRYAQAGYSHDRAHILTRHVNCSIRNFHKGGQTFAHLCDAINGDSGSPILARRDRTYKIVGLHVASARNRGYGVAITAGRIAAQLPRIMQQLSFIQPR